MDLITVDTRDEYAEKQSEERVNDLVEKFNRYSRSKRSPPSPSSPSSSLSPPLSSPLSPSLSPSLSSLSSPLSPSRYRDYLTDTDQEDDLSFIRFANHNNNDNDNNNNDNNNDNNIRTSFPSSHPSSPPSSSLLEEEEEDRVGKGEVVVMAMGEKEKVRKERKKRRYEEIFDISRIFWLMQTFILTRKMMVNTYRDSSLVIGRILQGIAMGVIVGCIFYQLGYTPTDIRSRVSALYSSASLEPYIILLLILISSSTELLVFDREYADGMIDVLPYFLASCISSFPLSIIIPGSFCIPFYYLVGLRSGWEYMGWFYAIMTMLMYCMESAGIMFSSILRSFGPSSVLANSTVSWWSIGCGFLINPASFPIYLSIISYTSPSSMVSPLLPSTNSKAMSIVIPLLFACNTPVCYPSPLSPPLPPLFPLHLIYIQKY